MPRRSEEQRIGSVVIYLCIAVTGAISLYVTVAAADLYRLLQSLYVLLSLAFQMHLATRAPANEISEIGTVIKHNTSFVS